MTTATNDLLWNRPTADSDDVPVLVLAHGAGAAMDTPFMNVVAEGLATAGVAVARFEFPYMQRRRREGSRRPPDRAPVLLDAWRAVIALVRADAPAATPLIIGGKSMGGRMASMVADESEVDGLICLGYPFHPPGRPEKTRTAHLESLTTPTLVVQGTRDTFGTPDDVETYPLAPSIRFTWLDDGDHSFKPRKASGHTHDAHLTAAVDAMVEFVRDLG